MDDPVKLRRMEPNRCYDSVERLWVNRRLRSKIFSIAFGYGLSDDGMWRPHAWALTTESIIETTVVQEAYFGIEMAPLEGFFDKLKTGPSRG
jgi:hypothetical protein